VFSRYCDVKIPIKDYKQSAKLAEKRFFENPKVSKTNKKLMERFLDVYDVSPARLEIFIQNIPKLLSKTDDIKRDMHNPDIINRIFKQMRDNLSPNYYNTVINVSNRFVRWVNDGDKPKGFKDIKGIPKKAQKRKLSPKDMISWEDGEKLIKATNSIQLKAIIATQLDGGFRPSEFVDLKYGDMTTKENFIIADVRDGKTGGRPVILWRAVPHLLRWLQSHPTKRKNDPLWMQEGGTKGENIRYDFYAIQKRIKLLAEKMNLDKPMDFYNLRHSACTISKLDNIPEEEAAKKFGHSLQYYTETYGRLTTEDSISRLSKVYGLEMEKRKIEKSIKCSRCDFVNTPDSELCEKCGAALTVKKALEGQEKVDLKDQFILKVISGLMKKGKIDDAIELVHDEKLEKELAKLTG